MKSIKELRGEAGAASVAAYRLTREIELKYAKDPVGKSDCQPLLNDIRRFLDGITGPLEEANDFDESCDLRGSNRMQLERCNRTIAFLQIRKAEIEQGGNITVLNNKRKA